MNLLKIKRFFMLIAAFLGMSFTLISCAAALLTVPVVGAGIGVNTDKQEYKDLPDFGSKVDSVVKIEENKSDQSDLKRENKISEPQKASISDKGWINPNIKDNDIK